MFTLNQNNKRYLTSSNQLIDSWLVAGATIFKAALMAKKGRPERGEDGRNKSVIFRLSQKELDALKEMAGTKKINAFCRDIVLSKLK